MVFIRPCEFLPSTILPPVIRRKCVSAEEFAPFVFLLCRVNTHDYVFTIMLSLVRRIVACACLVSSRHVLAQYGGGGGWPSFTCLRSMCRTCADVPLSFAVQLCAVTAVDPSAFILPGDDARLEFLELSCNVSTSS